MHKANRDRQEEFGKKVIGGSGLGWDGEGGAGDEKGEGLMSYVKKKNQQEVMMD